MNDMYLSVSWKFWILLAVQKENGEIETVMERERVCMWKRDRDVLCKTEIYSMKWTAGLLCNAFLFLDKKKIRKIRNIKEDVYVACIFKWAIYIITDCLFCHAIIERISISECFILDTLSRSHFRYGVNNEHRIKSWYRMERKELLN